MNANVRHAMAVFLKSDTIEYLKWVQSELGKQNQREASLSEAIEYVTLRHWMKAMIRPQERRTKAYKEQQIRKMGG